MSNIIRTYSHHIKAAHFYFIYFYFIIIHVHSHLHLWQNGLLRWKIWIIMSILFSYRGTSKGNTRHEDNLILGWRQSGNWSSHLCCFGLRLTASYSPNVFPMSFCIRICNVTNLVERKKEAKVHSVLGGRRCRDWIKDNVRRMSEEAHLCSQNDCKFLFGDRE